MHGSQKFFWHERLHNPSHDSYFFALESHFLAGFGGHHENRDMLEAFVALNAPAHVEAVHVGHVEIGNNEIDWVLLERFEALQTIFSFDDVVAALAERKTGQVADSLCVINNQNRLSHVKALLANVGHHPMPSLGGVS
jgi:hypothetical protein